MRVVVFKYDRKTQIFSLVSTYMRRTPIDVFNRQISRLTVQHVQVFMW